MKGLSSAADAERYHESSERESELRSLQDAIRNYYTCRSDLDLTGAQRSYLSLRLARQRTALIDLFIADGRFMDARQQNRSVATDLLDACGNFDRMGSAEKHEVQTTLSWIYYMHAKGLGQVPIGSVRTACRTKD
jgi:hypothetical protein